VARLTRGRLKKIAKTYRIVLEKQPGNHAALLKVARALRLLGKTKDAIGEYGQLARYLAQEGDLLNAISACKSILELDPDHNATQVELARLYAMAPADTLTQPMQTGPLLTQSSITTPIPTPGVVQQVGAPGTPAPHTQSFGAPIATPISPPTQQAPAVPQRPATPPPPPTRSPAPAPPRDAEDDRATVPMEAQEVATAFGVAEGPNTMTLDVADVEFVAEKRRQTPAEPEAVETEQRQATPRPLVPEPPGISAAEPVSRDSLPAIELSDADFDVINAEPDSADVVDTSRLTEGWDRIARNLASEDDALLVQAASAPRMDAVVARALDEDDLPQIPLFSALARDSFVRLVEKMQRRRLAPGELLVEAGRGADAIHVVARGSLAATRRGDDGQTVLLGHLGPGEFLGEFTFLTGVASPVSILSDEESEVFRIDNQVMRAIIAECPDVEDVLWRFFVDRMTHSLLATSSLFQGLEPERQLEIGRRFRPMDVKAETVVMREGEPAAGIYLVVSGCLRIIVKKGEAERRLAELRPGEFAGVRAAASGTPPTTRAVALEDTVVLVLPAGDFRALMQEEPSVRIAVETVSGMRRLLTDALFAGQTSYAADGFHNA